MNRTGLGKRWLAGVPLAAGGCGAVPDFLADDGRDAAQNALEKSVEAAGEEFVSGVVNDLWDLSDATQAQEADGEPWPDGPCAPSLAA